MPSSTQQVRGRDAGFTPGNGTPGSFAAVRHTEFEGPDLTPSTPAESVLAYFSAVSRTPDGRQLEHDAQAHVAAVHMLLCSADADTLDDASIERQAVTLTELSEQTGQPVAQIARDVLEVRVDDISLERAEQVTKRLAALSRKSAALSTQRAGEAQRALQVRAERYTLACADTSAGFVFTEDREYRARRLSDAIRSGSTLDEAIARV
ncbi:hypothetical protein [Pseudoclavibacter soli]|uniref:hypothetical protein n=1 Tax=Pseudoclavibacter soli TaxID=452623 RepID=UPI00040EE616|nr:hypothetical protein [Pseudoclavibacter soli]